MTVAAAPTRRSRPLPPWPAGRPLRAWQRAAVGALEGHEGEAFVASATPAAGKTTFGLHVAHRILSAGHVERVAVVAPTRHICRVVLMVSERVDIPRLRVGVDATQAAPSCSCARSSGASTAARRAPGCR